MDWDERRELASDLRADAGAGCVSAPLADRVWVPKEDPINEGGYLSPE